jgi:predicted ATPase
MRWYKSFNISYNAGAARRGGNQNAPWNLWKMSSGRQESYPFIEIPLEVDITTVVGANESGKSHLLGAISKVITGFGVPGDPFGDNKQGSPYTQTDLCHFSPLLGKNLEIWPNIGIGLEVSDDEFEMLRAAAGAAAQKPAPGGTSEVTLILPALDGKAAVIYLGYNPVNITADQLKAVRALLPKLQFINSQIAISDHVTLRSLIEAYGAKSPRAVPLFDLNGAQQAAEMIERLSFVPNAAPDAGVLGQIAALKGELNRRKLSQSNGELELLLFRDVLGIKVETLQKLDALEQKDRGHAESLVESWNREIDDKLNLSRYWQQDQEFSLRVDFKNGVLYFEISDKTGAVYTFRERSSGLRYFLSYYIQARALEASRQSENSVILMDEPDSFLSILGQRNLLSIFESLISAETSKQSMQVVYTTHSPFLINRNFPRRIRLVRKGDAEEGTQFVDKSRVRRFEPIRSALGIDLAQTLFMGAINLIFEGPTDQYLFSEGIRLFSGHEGMTDLLDLNSVVIVSAESAPGVEKLISSSQWGDEPLPTVVAVLDNDEAGCLTKDRLTGKARNSKKLLDPDQVVLLSDAISPYGENKAILSIEDIVPAALYKRGVRKYMERWYSREEVTDVQLEAITQPGDVPNGLAKWAQSIFDQLNNHEQRFDKLGVLQEIIHLFDQPTWNRDEGTALGQNILSLSRYFRERIDFSQKLEQQKSAKQALQRIIGEFFIQHKESANTHTIEILLSRLLREAPSFGQDSPILANKLVGLATEIKDLRSKGIMAVTKSDWNAWRDRLEAIRSNPLANETVTPIVNSAQPSQEAAKENVRIESPEKV